MRTLHEPRISIGLDTTFAGTNPTGVGLYSRRLATHIRLAAARENLAFHCIGPSCTPQGRTGICATLQEWPIFTQTVVPAFVLRRQIDILHSTSHLGPLMTPAIKIITIHDLLFRRYPNDYNPLWLAVTNTILPRLLPIVSAIIADSKATARDLHRFYNVPVSKIRVIYPGFDRLRLPVRPAGEEAAAGQTVKPPYILCLGPWVGRKNLQVVVSAFARLAGRDPDIRLVITGSKPRGMKGAGLGEIVRRLPVLVQQRITLAGHLPPDELQKTICQAAVLAYPSRFEGFGLPPLEAMSCQVPVVAADTPVAREVYGDAAIFAAPDDPEAWANHIYRLLVDSTLRSHQLIKGLSRSRLFSWERCADDCLELYRGLSTTKPRKSR